MFHVNRTASMFSWLVFSPLPIVGQRSSGWGAASLVMVVGVLTPGGRYVVSSRSCCFVGGRPVGGPRAVVRLGVVVLIGVVVLMPDEGASFTGVVDFVSVTSVSVFFGIVFLTWGVGLMPGAFRYWALAR